MTLKLKYDQRLLCQAGHLKRDSVNLEIPMKQPDSLYCRFTDLKSTEKRVDFCNVTVFNRSTDKIESLDALLKNHNENTPL